MAETNQVDEVLVLGAGAAGLWAAARAAECGARVRVLERTGRTGTKVLASGGTRCNLTTTLPVEEALRLFGTRGERFLRRAFRALSPTDIREHFHALGVPTVEAPMDKVFPASDRARDVRDALEAWARSAGVEFRFEARAMNIVREDDAWLVELEDGSIERAPKLILAIGGKSYPKSGTTGDAYAWFERLGLPMVEPVPALVPLTSDAEWVHEMSGISWADPELRMQSDDGRRVGQRRRPILFTHHGVSGPGAMDLSEPVARGIGRTLVVNLFPDETREELRERLIGASGTHGSKRLVRCLSEVFGTVLPKKLLRALLRQAELTDERLGQLDKRRRHLLLEACFGLEVPISGTRGFDFAEVTAGGLDLRAVDPGTLGVRGAEGLQVIGEALDLQGPIGGLNFTAAWATAELAGQVHGSSPT